jgi:hypothetical protein
MDTSLPRRAAVLITAVGAIAASRFHELTGLGQPIPAFAAKGDEVARAAGYAFAIWGLLYLGIIIYAVFQLRRESDLTRRLGWASAVAFLCIGGWVVAASLDAMWLTVALIVGAAVLLTAPLVAARADIAQASRSERWLVAWPLSALAGWVSVASALNIVTVLNREGLLPEPKTAIAGVAVAIVTALAVWVSRRLGLIAYAIPIAWGLAAIAVAERERHPMLALAAAAGAIIALAGGFFAARGSLRFTQSASAARSGP